MIVSGRRGRGSSRRGRGGSRRGRWSGSWSRRGAAVDGSREELGDAIEETNGARVAAGDAGVPADQAVGDVGAVAVGGTATAQVPAGSDRARVVHAGGDVVLAGVGCAGRGEELDQAVTARRAGDALGAVPDHLGDGGQRARVLDDAGVVAGAGAVVALHHARVVDAAVGGWDPQAAVALLHDDGEDEARVDLRLARDGVDGSLEILVLGRRVVGGGARELRAAVVQDGLIVGEPGGGISNGAGNRDARGALTVHRKFRSTGRLRATPGRRRRLRRRPGRR